jgi:hypothetical protein
MSVVGILIALGLLVWLAYRGWSILLLAPLCALRGWVADADRAIDHILRSIRLSPVDPQLGYHYGGLSVAHVIKGEYEKALEYARRSAREMPRYVSAWIFTELMVTVGEYTRRSAVTSARL